MYGNVFGSLDYLTLASCYLVRKSHVVQAHRTGHESDCIRNLTRLCVLSGRVLASAKINALFVSEVETGSGTWCFHCFLTAESEGISLMSMASFCMIHLSQSYHSIIAMSLTAFQVDFAHGPGSYELSNVLGEGQ